MFGGNGEFVKTIDPRWDGKSGTIQCTLKTCTLKDGSDRQSKMCTVEEKVRSRCKEEHLKVR